MIGNLKRSWNTIRKTLQDAHKVSDALKLPIFDKKFVSRFFGVQIASVAMAMSLVAYPTQAFDYEMSRSSEPETELVFVTTTESHYAFPLETTLGMSQAYHGFHPGVDLRAPYGTPVYSIDDGIVIEVKKMFVGYGHFVRIAHNGTLSSLYAHLDKVEVSAGKKIAKGENIGSVGMTGWSTGPHLHLETYVGNKAVNPMNYISASR